MSENIFESFQIYAVLKDLWEKHPNKVVEYIESILTAEEYKKLKAMLHFLGVRQGPQASHDFLFFVFMHYKTWSKNKVLKPDSFPDITFLSMYEVQHMKETQKKMRNKK